MLATEDLALTVGYWRLSIESWFLKTYHWKLVTEDLAFHVLSSLGQVRTGWLGSVGGSHGSQCQPHHRSCSQELDQYTNNTCIYRGLMPPENLPVLPSAPLLLMFLSSTTLCPHDKLFMGQWGWQRVCLTDRARVRAWGSPLTMGPLSCCLGRYLYTYIYIDIDQEIRHPAKLQTEWMSSCHPDPKPPSPHRLAYENQLIILFIIDSLSDPSAMPLTGYSFPSKQVSTTEGCTLDLEQ